MRVWSVIWQVAILFGVYFVGMFIQRLFHLIIPGSVIGLIIMFLFLSFNIVQVSWIKAGATFLIAHLAMFFLPATVGFLHYYELFLGKGSLLILTTIASTILVIAISGHTSQLIAKKRGMQDE